MRVGVVSDTHGYLNPRVLELLDGVEHILHAGDIGDDVIVQELGRIAPVTAVRGNNDREGPTSLYPEESMVELDGLRIYLTHQVKVPKGPNDAKLRLYHDAGADLVVYGHSHFAYQADIAGIRFFNPGAAGKRRFNTVPSLGLLELGEGHVQGWIVKL